MGRSRQPPWIFSVGMLPRLGDRPGCKVRLWNFLESHSVGRSHYCDYRSTPLGSLTTENPSLGFFYRSCDPKIIFYKN
jgi:hypothetical protein